MSTKENYVNNGANFLNAPAAAGDTTLTLGDATSFPAAGGYRVRVDNELMFVSASTATSGGTLTVTRAIEGTTAASHPEGAYVQVVVTDLALRSLARQSVAGTNVTARRELNFIQGGVTWTLTDDPANDRVNVSATAGGGSEAPYVAPPAISQFTFVNQIGSTATTGSNGLYLSTPQNGSDQVSLLVMPLPAAPYTLIGRSTHLLAGTMHAGYCLYDSASGKVQTYSWGSSTWYVFDWSSPTSYAGTTARNVPFSAFSPLRWIKIRDDGTNRTISLSNDGINWNQVYQIGRTDFLTPTSVGIYVDADNQGNNYLDGSTLLSSWNLANS